MKRLVLELSDEEAKCIMSLYSFLGELRRREVQALHAGLSRRDWFSTEQAANQLRDKIDRALAAEGHHERGSTQIRPR